MAADETDNRIAQDFNMRFEPSAEDQIGVDRNGNPIYIHPVTHQPVIFSPETGQFVPHVEVEAPPPHKEPEATKPDPNAPPPADENKNGIPDALEMQPIIQPGNKQEALEVEAIEAVAAYDDDIVEAEAVAVEVDDDDTYDAA